MLLLKLIFKAAIKNGYTASNPVEEIEFPKNIHLKIRKAVSDEKLRIACRSMNTLALRVVLILRNTGMRLGELFQLEMENFDFENKTITIKSVRHATTKNYQN